MPVGFVFLVLPQLHILDLAGPDQALHEAIDFGADFTLSYCGIGESVTTSAGLPMGKLPHFSRMKLKEGDFLIIPGSRVRYLQSEAFKQHTELFQWIRNCYQKKVNLVSICAGAFVLGYAGMLDHIHCTTHFQLTTPLQQRFPKALVCENVLYKIENGVYTSAGITSGIDLLLHIIEQLDSGLMAHKVARELVIYTRRDGQSPQHTVFLQFRNHIHDGIHRVQDHILANIHLPLTVSDLAALAGMSERNFTRIFKQETGSTVTSYKTLVRAETARALSRNPDLSKSQIAAKVGLKSEKQLTRILK